MHCLWIFRNGQPVRDDDRIIIIFFAITSTYIVQKVTLNGQSREYSNIGYKTFVI